ncbi:MAG TPA: tetratricopeptide repeat protein [Rubrobacteraceae bacterium]|nr:tetratricopeptide repeat protein [Rubrobacteraceae bacterium]
MSSIVFKISAGFLVGALVVIAGALFLSNHYTDEQRRLAAAGDTKGAEEAAQKAIRLDPFDTDPLEAQSFLLQQQGLNDQAAEALQEAVKRDPNNYMPHLMLGNLQMVKLNDLEGAARSYRQVLELNPRATVARNGLAQALIRQGKLEEAKKEYEKIREEKEITDQGLYDLGRIYVRTGEPKEGYKAILQARRRSSKGLEQLKGSAKTEREDLIQSMDLALADALVVEGKYNRALKVISESSSDQAPALYELLSSDPEAYRDSVVNSEIY